jgi:hypothetical protein
MVCVLGEFPLRDQRRDVLGPERVAATYDRVASRQAKQVVEHLLLARANPLFQFFN